MQSLSPVYEEQHILIEEVLFCSHWIGKFVPYYHKVINVVGINIHKQQIMV